jgi:hypothetical protein
MNAIHALKSVSNNIFQSFSEKAEGGKAVARKAKGTFKCSPLPPCSETCSSL